MDWQPFAQPRIAKHTRSRALVEAFVLVPTSPSSGVIVQVVVPVGDGCEDWARRAETAAIVTVVAVRARLRSRQGDPEC